MSGCAFCPWRSHFVQHEIDLKTFVLIPSKAELIRTLQAVESIRRSQFWHKNDYEQDVRKMLVTYRLHKCPPPQKKPKKKGIVHANLRLRKPEAQKSAKGPRAPGAGFQAKAQAFQIRDALLLKKCLKIIPKPYFF